MAQGRHMVQKKKENELERARQIIKAAEEKRRRAAKKTFREAAKKARKWRLAGKLKPADIPLGGASCPPTFRDMPHVPMVQ